MATNCRQVLTIIDHFGLDLRSAYWAGVKVRILQGRLTEQRAKGFLRELIAKKAELDKHPNYLAAPTAEDLAVDPADIELGDVSDSDARWGLWLSDRARQCILTGVTGCGKSTLQRRISMMASEYAARSGRDFSLIVFDSKKDSRDFRKRLPGDWLLFSYHDNLRIALTPPIGVPPAAWFQHVAVCFAARTNLKAARRTLARVLCWLFEVLNPQPRTKIAAPTFRLALQVLQRSPKDLWAAKPEYLQSLISALQDFVDAGGACVNNEHGLELDRDVIATGKNVILGLDDISPPELRLFLIDLLVSQVFLAKLHRNEKTDRTCCCLVIDEADQNISGQAEEAFGTSFMPLGSIFKQGREYGLMSSVAVSFLKNVSKLVLANTSDKFVFNTDDSESLRIAMSTVLMPSRAVDMLPALRQGECIVRQGLSSYPKAFLGLVDYIAPDRDPSPPDDPCPHIPGRDLDDLPEVLEALEKLVKGKRRSDLDRVRFDAGGITQKARQLLDVAAQNLWAPAASLWRLTGKVPSPSVQKSVRRELCDKSLAKAEELRLGSANVLLYSLTEEGWAHLNRPRPKGAGGGSIAHQHISHWIAMCGEKAGMQTYVEYKVPGSNHAVDCAFQVDAGALDVFEVIVTCDKNIVEHLCKLAPCDCVRTITIVSTQKREAQRLRSSLKDVAVVQQLGDRLQYALAGTYLRKVFP